jgi:hypothetical protein
MIKLRRRDTDGLVEGHRVESDSGLDDVDAFLDAMRSEFGSTPAPEPRPTLASTLDGRRPLRPASGPRVHTTFPARRPRRTRLRPVAAVAAAGAVLFGGLASAGALPGPVQRATADVTSHVGIELPGRTETQPDVHVQDGSGSGDSSKPAEPRPGVTPTTAPSAPGAPAQPAPAPTTVPAPSAPTVPTVPSLPLPEPTPTTVPNLLGELLPPLAPVGPTGPEGPAPPRPVRNLLDHLLP